jgi:hypothetical protein
MVATITGSLVTRKADGKDMNWNEHEFWRV